jgi:hypothetical protein
MTERGEDIVNRIRDNLLMIAREAEIKNVTQEALSAEAHAVQIYIDRLIADRNRYGTLRLHIGTAAVQATEFPDGGNDFLSSSHHMVDPYTTWPLETKIAIPTHTFVTDPVYEPFYGYTSENGENRYFDLATMGLTLEDGGDLMLSEPKRED